MAIAIDEGYLRKKEVLITISQHLLKINTLIRNNVLECHSSGDYDLSESTMSSKSTNKAGEDYASSVDISYFQELPSYLLAISKMILALVSNFKSEGQDFFEKCLETTIEEYIILLDQLYTANSEQKINFEKIGGWNFETIDLGNWQEIYETAFSEPGSDRSDAICLTFTRGVTKFFPKMLKYSVFVEKIVAPLYHLCFKFMEKNLFE